MQAKGLNQFAIDINLFLSAHKLSSILAGALLISISTSALCTIANFVYQCSVRKIDVVQIDGKIYCNEAAPVQCRSSAGTMVNCTVVFKV